MNLRKRMYESVYGLAKEESDLSWHREDIPEFLKRAAQPLNRSGNALDIGCGTGVCSAYMAQMGLKVTALDFVSKALDLARTRADKMRVNLNLVQADVVDWETAQKYDLILDSGCLHSLSWKKRVRYKKQVLKWMSSNCSYILLHFGKEHFFNFKIVGPIRKNAQEIEQFFAPELKLKESYCEKNKRAPLVHYWFVLKK